MTADEIKALRLYLGLSQEKFAQLLSVSRRQVARWEAGESTPRPVYEKLLREVR